MRRKATEEVQKGRREGVANKAQGLPKSCKWRKRNRMQRIDKENKWLITVHPTQLKMKHRHKTSERHILHRHILTAMTKQCNHKQKTRNLSLFVGTAGWMYSSREAVILLSLPVLFLPHVERNGSGKAWLQILQVPCACRVQFISLVGQCFPWLCSAQGTGVVCAHAGMVKSWYKLPDRNLGLLRDPYFLSWFAVLLWAGGTPCCWSLLWF